MIDKAMFRPDAFALALGAVAVKSSYFALPVVANDRINAAWDEKLRETSPGQPDDFAPDGACAGLAT